MIGYPFIFINGQNLFIIHACLFWFIISIMVDKMIFHDSFYLFLLKNKTSAEFADIFLQKIQWLKPPPFRINYYIMFADI